METQTEARHKIRVDHKLYKKMKEKATDKGMTVQQYVDDLLLRKIETLKDC